MSLDILIFVATCLGLWYRAVWLVEGAAHLAKRLGIPELVIGLTVVALGTSAPEFAVTVNAALRGRADIFSGNVVKFMISGSRRSSLDASYRPQPA